MKRIKGANGHGKRVESTRQNRWREFDQGDTADQGPRIFAMGPSKPSGVETCPHLVFQ